MNRSVRWSKQGILAACVTAGVGLVTMSGCTHVSAVRRPMSFLNSQAPIEVWVIRRHNDSVFAVQQPRTQGDTLIGFLTPNNASLTQYVEIPGSDIKQMRAKQPSLVRTAALIGVIGGATLYTYTSLVHGSGGAPIPVGSPGCDCDFDSVCGC
jgi:hypothetical protein